MLVNFVSEEKYEKFLINSSLKHIMMSTREDKCTTFKSTEITLLAAADISDEDGEKILQLEQVKK